MKTKNISPEQRIFLTDELYEEVKFIQNKPWKPFWKSFSSFKQLERWKKRQNDPRLW